MTDILLDAVIDTAKLLPFLLLTYLVMEYIEDRMSEKAAGYLARADKMGPLIGAAAGIVPQCGFSATAAGFYAGGLISAGTLLAVFLSTSDEMLPVLISSAAPLGTILTVLCVKFAAGALAGFAVDLFMRKKNGGAAGRVRIHEICENEHCHCDGEEGHGIFLPALRHTLKTAGYIFLVSILAGLLLRFIGKDALTAFLTGKRLLGVLFAAVLGLVPNCAISVLLTTLYADGLLSGGQLLAGLLVGAGVGLLVLFRSNRHLKENLKITGLLLGFGVVFGLLAELIGIL